MIPGTELIIGHTYYTKAGHGGIIPFTVTHKADIDDMWYDGGLPRSIKNIEFTEKMAEFIGVGKITQGGKVFSRSSFRNNAWIWMNRPLHTKSFDYYMCGCGKIISNCGFSARHKCK